MGEIVSESALLSGRKYWGLELGESLDKMLGQQDKESDKIWERESALLLGRKWELVLGEMLEI